MKECLILVGLGLLYALSSDLLSIGYNLLTPGVASTILFVFPVMVAIIMAIFYKERIDNFAVLSIAIGMLRIFALGVQNSISGVNITGLDVLLLSAVLYALYIIVVVNKSQPKVSEFKPIFYSPLFSLAYYGFKIILGKESL